MKKNILAIVAYWVLAILLLASILYSMDYSFLGSLFVSLSFVPASILFSHFLQQISFDDRWQGIRQLILLILFVLILTFAFVMYTNALMFYHHVPAWRIPDIPKVLLNPIFIAAMLVLLMIGSHRLRQYMATLIPDKPQDITFISDRQSITLPTCEILYVESCDTEVRIHATGGRCYRNKTAISAWTNLLGHGFLRTHRSFLVNIEACEGMEHGNVLIGEEHLPVSRKYKAEVQRVLS